VAAQVQADIDEDKALGIEGTPTFLINHQRVVGAQPIEVLRDAVQQELAQGDPGVTFVDRPANTAV
jgi:protein-disulfide isomerase